MQWKIDKHIFQLAQPPGLKHWYWAFGYDVWGSWIQVQFFGVGYFNPFKTARIPAALERGKYHMYYNNLRRTGASILVKIISKFFHKRHKAGDVSWRKAHQLLPLSLKCWGAWRCGGVRGGKMEGVSWSRKHQNPLKDVTCWWLAVESSKGKGSTFLTAAVVTMSDIFWVKTLSSYHMKKQYSHPRGVATNRRSIIFDVSWGVACIQVPQHQRNLSISKLPPKLCVIASKGGCHDESHGSYMSLITWTTAFWRLHPGKWTDET